MPKLGTSRLVSDKDRIHSFYHAFAPLVFVTILMRSHDVGMSDQEAASSEGDGEGLLHPDDELSLWDDVAQTRP
jgi:hypothetical protein